MAGNVCPATEYVGEGKMKLCGGCRETKPEDLFSNCLREKSGKQSKCKICRSKISRAWYELNKDRTRIVTRAYREANPEKIKATQRKYKKENRDKTRAYEKANPEKVRAWKAKYISLHREKHMDAVRKYQRENPEKIRDVARRRRKYITDTTVERFPSVEIFERDKWICQICGDRVDKNLTYPSPMSKSLDHILPVSRGGSHERKNVQLAHLCCNKRIGAGGEKQLRLL